MKQVRTAEDIKRLGAILFVAAHPDDETFLAGGIMATAVKNGQTVVGVSATRGEAGSQDEAVWPSATIGAVREQELVRALRELGVATHYVFDYPDGGCAAAQAGEAVGKLRAIISRHKPDTILTFGPDGMTGHPDHQAVSAWADAAVQGLDLPVQVLHAVQTKENYEHNLKQLDAKLNIFFNIDRPPIIPEGRCTVVYHLPPDIENQKMRALAAMPSQTHTLFKVIPAAAVSRAFSCEYFVAATKRRP